MLFHIQVFGKQVSITVRDKDKLSKAVKEALKFYNLDKNSYVLLDDKREKLNLTSPAKTVKDDSVLIVISPEDYKRELKIREENKKLEAIQKESMRKDELKKARKRVSKTRKSNR